MLFVQKQTKNWVRCVQETSTYKPKTSSQMHPQFPFKFFPFSLSHIFFLQPCESVCCPPNHGHHHVITSCDSHHGPPSPSMGPRRFQAATTEATNHHCPVFGCPRGLLLGTVDRAPPWRQLQQTIARADHGGNGLCLGSFDLFVLDTGWKGGQRFSKVETKKIKKMSKNIGFVSSKIDELNVKESKE